MRWPEEPPHLALNPPYFVYFLFFCFVFFPFFASNRQKTLFLTLEKGIFGLFLSVSLSFSFAFLGLPLFQFLFLCLSLVLFFFYSFLSFFIAFFLFLVFLSFFPFLSSLLLFHERNIRKYDWSMATSCAACIGAEIRKSDRNIATPCGDCIGAEIRKYDRSMAISPQHWPAIKPGPDWISSDQGFLIGDPDLLVHRNCNKH